MLSRPEPFPRATLARRHLLPAAVEGADFRTRQLSPTRLISSPGKLWWYTAAQHIPASREAELVVTFAPPLFPAALELFPNSIHWFDLLDDWTAHPAFSRIRRQLEGSLGHLKDSRVQIVTANSEQTTELATRFGRSDVRLVPNGAGLAGEDADPETPGKLPIVGYGGKFGHRQNWELIQEVVRSLPDVQFEFAGPFLERAIKRNVKRLGRLPNFEYLGDLSYLRYREVASRWMIGWVPHSVGPDEIGGDVMKIYEYWSDGAHVLMTPIAGYERWPWRQNVLSSAREHAQAIRDILHRTDRPPIYPEELTWSARFGPVLEVAADLLTARRAMCVRIP